MFQSMLADSNVQPKLIIIVPKIKCGKSMEVES